MVALCRLCEIAKPSPGPSPVLKPSSSCTPGPPIFHSASTPKHVTVQACMCTSSDLCHCSRSLTPWKAGLLKRCPSLMSILAKHPDMLLMQQSPIHLPRHCQCEGWGTKTRRTKGWHMATGCFNAKHSPVLWGWGVHNFQQLCENYVLANRRLQVSHIDMSILPFSGARPSREARSNFHQNGRGHGLSYAMGQASMLPPSPLVACCPEGMEQLSQPKGWPHIP